MVPNSDYLIDEFLRLPWRCLFTTNITMVHIQIVQKESDKSTYCGYIQDLQFRTEDGCQKFMGNFTFGKFWRGCAHVSARYWEGGSILSGSDPG